jgi:hypothetical protein
MEHVRTVKEPKQAIPTFAETIALLMLVRTLLRHFVYLCLIIVFVSPITSMLSSMWTSRSRTTPIVCSS